MRRTRRPYALAAWHLTLSLLGAGVPLHAAQAQGAGAPLVVTTRLNPGPVDWQGGRFGYLTTPGSRPLGHGNYRLELTDAWAKAPIRVAVDGVRRNLLDWRHTTTMGGAFGLGARTSVSLRVTGVLGQSTGAGFAALEPFAAPGTSGMRDPRAFALGDTQLGVTTLLYQAQAATSPDTKAAGYALALSSRLWLPTGFDADFASAGSVQSELGLVQEYNLLVLEAALELSWLHRYEPTTFAGLRFRDELRYVLALAHRGMEVSWLRAIAELRGSVDAGAPFARSDRTPLEVFFALRAEKGDWLFGAGFGTGLSVAPGVPALQGLMQVTYQPKTRDQDGDGIPDHLDRCPMLPEDFDGVEDDDGCPDVDEGSVFDDDFFSDDDEPASDLNAAPDALAPAPAAEGVSGTNAVDDAPSEELGDDTETDISEDGTPVLHESPALGARAGEPAPPPEDTLDPDGPKTNAVLESKDAAVGAPSKVR